jgi:hypothetical protein
MSHEDPVLIAVANSALVQAPPPTSERAIASINGVEFPGSFFIDWNRPWEPGSLYPDGGSAHIENFWGTLLTDHEYLPIRAAMRPEVGDAWAIETNIFPGGSDKRGSYLRAYIRAVEQKQSAPVSYIRLLFRGQQIQNMPQQYRRLLERGQIRLDANAHFTCFSRPAVLAQLSGTLFDRDLPQSEWLLGLTYAAPRLSTNEQRSARIVVDLFAGNRGSFVREEGFDVEGRPVWAEAIRRGGFSKGKNLVFAQSAYRQELFDSFDVLAQRVCSLWFEHVEAMNFDILQHQLFAADETTYPEIAVAHIGMAFEALVDSAVAQRGKYGRLAMKQKDYDKLLGPVYDAINTQYVNFPEARDALKKRVKGANDRSIERKRTIFWESVVEWTPDSEQLALFKLRHVMAHTAGIPQARLPDGLRVVEEKKRAFRNLFVGAYLRYLRFAGEMNDAVSPGMSIVVPATKSSVAIVPIADVAF